MAIPEGDRKCCITMNFNLRLTADGLRNGEGIMSY